MVFVLYLAGLAVLVIVLALGFEFLQRRGAPAAGAPTVVRQEPVVAPGKPAPTPPGAAIAVSPAASTAAPSAAPVSVSVMRGGTVRDIVLIVAVALLALIALGS